MISDHLSPRERMRLYTDPRQVKYRNIYSLTRMLAFNKK
uniref:Uncharacterized protein n=1 Tax=Anguilla anguilla TaxID=7936 RepID=A0A0E9SLM9_ANGAN